MIFIALSSDGRESMILILLLISLFILSMRFVECIDLLIYSGYSWYFSRDPVLFSMLYSGLGYIPDHLPLICCNQDCRQYPVLKHYSPFHQVSLYVPSDETLSTCYEVCAFHCVLFEYELYYFPSPLLNINNFHSILSKGILMRKTILFWSSVQIHMVNGLWL
jgi:hypothetical protein